jgi:penicillin-binding protein 1A
MKFERLSAPSIPMPDLVAFNQRVRDAVGPWFARRWVKRLAIVGAVLFAIFAGIWLFFASTIPSTDTLLAYKVPLPTYVRGYNGDPVQSFARERRVELAYDEIPPVVVHAFISAEDKTFFSHHGIDYTGLIGAVADYGVKTITGGGRAKGGSTITQQVAKGLLQDSSYNIGRKIREAILAFRLESVLTKQQILQLYLNQIFLGRNAYGIQAAARAYFDKDINQLTLPEAARPSSHT